MQEAWLRWDGRKEEVDSPRAYLVTIVTRLCFNELDSARARREESRSDRLPEPLDLDAGGIGRVEMLDQISMAFLVVLQRLTRLNALSCCSATSSTSTTKKSRSWSARISRRVESCLSARDRT